MTETERMITQRYLDFSCEKIAFTISPGEISEGVFEIHSSNKAAKGIIISTDTRMRTSTGQFAGEHCLISYAFDGTYLETGATVLGKFIVLSTVGEYVLPFEIRVECPKIEGTIGVVKDLFHFTNLAKLNWQEAVSIFYKFL